MQRIYCKKLKIGDKTFILKDKEIMHQLLKVLRNKVGDYIIFFNGIDDIEYVYTIESIDKKEIIFTIFDSFKSNNEIDFELNLYQALPNKLEKIEYILQKGVEVGMSNFYFWKAERSQKLFMFENKKERFEKIIIEAIEQSGRNKIPKLEFLSELDLKKLEKNENVFFHTDGLCYSEQCHSELDSESLEKIKHPSSKFNLLQYSDDRKIPRNSPLLVPRLPPQLTLTLPLSHTKEEKATSPRMTCSTLKDLKLDYTKNINLFIGPEGGFSSKEIDEFEKNKFKKVFLGNRILRTETAGIVSGFYVVQKGS